MIKLKDDFNWKNYLQAGGSSTVEAFGKMLHQTEAPDDRHGVSEAYISLVRELRQVYCPATRILSNTTKLLNELNKWINEFPLVDPSDSTDDDAWGAVRSSFVEIVGQDSNKEVAKEFCVCIELYSTWLAIERPGLFYPWYFRYSYNMFDLICKEIAGKYGFKVPEKLPLKSDYLGRFNYYAEICQSMADFADSNDLTAEEVCAFFYDYAPKTLGGMSALLYRNEDLPEPHSAFFIGGSEDDIFLSKHDSPITPWQCNPEASPGDIAVMYTTTPVSSVSSFWRCVSEGFDDPFFWYYRCTYISNQEQVRPLSLKKMKADSVLRDVPIVRKNMQGVNGAEISPSQFNYLADLVKAKTPRLEFYKPTTDLELTCEHDVEEQLIKPVLLAGSGIREDEYIQQWIVPIGNHNERALPRTDFVVYPVKHDGHTTGSVLIEAKYRIHNTQELQDAKQQARGYANLLRCKYAIVASAEGVWVMGAEDDFEHVLLQTTWGKLENPDTFKEMAAYLRR